VKTDTHTPEHIFRAQQRLLVPLFQRPYVWNKDLQWEPMWRDLKRVLSRYLAQPDIEHQPHFLGAVVVQQVQSPIGEIQQRTIIDGQQRLTTLQLMFDAIHAQLESVGAKRPAGRLKKLIENDDDSCNKPEDKFKVWPTNKDRPAFNEVLAAPFPINYENLEHSKSKMALAHQFFSESAREWLLENGEVEVQKRAEVLDLCCRELLQIVVIDLAVNENAQEIFETLNARGAVLTAADLIKNFVFQRLSEKKVDVEVAYLKFWKDFETPFWEKEINYGRVKFQRSSLFINHWLIAKIGEEVLNREIFSTFKNYADHESRISMLELLEQIHAAAARYKEVFDGSENKEGQISRVELFAYRLNSMELDVLRPILITLVDPTEVAVPQDELEKAVSVIESWMVRRLLVRATNKNYNKLVVEMVQVVNKDREHAGTRLEKYFSEQTSVSSYWPDDVELSGYVSQMQIYRNLYRSRIRMILEALEDHSRGWIGAETSKSGMRMKRGSFAIEHIMPQRWQMNWPIKNHSEAEREVLLQTIGNLTLLTTKLNSSVSNGPWASKSGELTKHDVLLINKQVQELGSEGWGEDQITSRTTSIIQTLINIWPVPEGHKSRILTEKPEKQTKVGVIDLISAGLVSAGQTLYPKQNKHVGKVAQILDDGRIQCENIIFDSLSLAGIQIRKRNTNGWTFWLVDEKTRKSMADLREEYRELIGLEDGEDEIEDSDGSDE
jgi:uncharacterized protein with ParB-like and HNH nuclease domain